MQSYCDIEVQRQSLQNTNRMLTTSFAVSVALLAISIMNVLKTTSSNKFQI